MFGSTGAFTTRAALAGLLACCALLLASGSASAAITLEEGADKATTPKLELDFGDASGNVEFLQSLKWLSPKAGALTGDLASEGGGGCGDFSEFWGQSYPNQDGTGPAPVVAGQRGTWEAASNRTVLIESVSAHACSGNTPEIPVRTRYTFFDEGPAANVVRMERRISFAADQLPNPAVQGMRFYVPRLPGGTYNQEIYPNAAGTALNTIGSGGPTAHQDWNETWVAIDSSTTHAGMLIFHQPDGTHKASVTSDNDSSSGSNNSGVTLDRPAAGWLEPVTETEYFCFYDETTWPLLTRSPTNLPTGCATPEVPVNVAAPKISAGAGNPRAGETFTATPGDWEHATASFAYQWYRCSGNACSPIGSAASSTYTAGEADVGHSLKVKVTATASTGTETDYAFSNLAGSVSGHVYEDANQPGRELAGARVQICRLKGSPCRSTVTGPDGLYSLQAPTLGYYRVTAFPPAGSNAVARTRTTVTKVEAESDVEGQDVVLPLPQPPPPRVQFGGPGVRATSAEGVPVVHWQEPFQISIEAPFAKEVEARIEFPSGLLKRLLPCAKEAKPGEPAVGIFKFCFQPLFPNHGAGRVVIVGSAPRSPAEKQKAEEEEAEEEEQEDEEAEEEEEPEEEIETPEEEEEEQEEREEEEREEEEGEEAEEEGERESGNEEEIVFPIYIDPSGVVRTTEGDPIGGARVTLLQAASANGPFTAVPDGSAVMSPMNRNNPDESEADGHFGWDVVAGFYKVRVQKSGCHAPGDASQAATETGVMTIPPPVTNLDLRLDCSPIIIIDRFPPQPVNPPAEPLKGTLSLPKSAIVKVGVTGKYAVPGARATCPAAAAGACSVSVALTAKAPAKRGKKGKPVLLKIPAASSPVAAGAAAGVAGKLSRSALARLEKARRMTGTVAVQLSVPGGTGADGSIAVKLKAPPRPRRR